MSDLRDTQMSNSQHHDMGISGPLFERDQITRRRERTQATSLGCFDISLLQATGGGTYSALLPRHFFLVPRLYTRRPFRGKPKLWYARIRETTQQPPPLLSTLGSPVISHALSHLPTGNFQATSQTQVYSGSVREALAGT